MADTPTADALRSLLVTLLAGATEEPADEWDARLGELVRVDLTRSPASNWTVAAKGADAQAVEAVVALVRPEMLYVRW
jgi:hypothetical protein